MAPSSHVSNSPSESTLHEDDDSAPLLGRKAQSLIACNQKLQELGINNTITLPRICVIGDQSTGKSSLIEAISTIQVPKAKGCCTQCPLAINLSSGATPSSPWMCTVSIEQHYDFVEALVPKGVTKNHPFGPWQKRATMKVDLVKKTYRKDEVPELIEAAQSAVINPGTKFQDYLGPHRRMSNVRGPQFSPNVIRLDVSEGDWPNLSFIDLPGVIANTGKEKDKWLVKLIENLVKQYVSAERSVNMLTLPMTHDFENSRACAFVQERQAQKNTLAVFTKADLVDRDEQARIIEKFVGKDDLGFKHGYHFVVMPDNMSQEAARAVEAKTFAEEPWSGQTPQHRSRLGVDNLRLYLRRLLFEKTAETLPDNLKSIEVRLAEVEEELLSLPPPPNEGWRPFQLAQSVTRFENVMKSLFQGGSTRTGTSVRASWKQNMLSFRDLVIKSKPIVFLSTEDEKERLTNARNKVQGGASSNAVVVNSSDEGAPPMPVKSEAPKRSTASRTHRSADHTHRIHLEEIRAINEQYDRACFSGEIEVDALEEMFRLSVQYWPELLHVFMKNKSKLLPRQILEVVDEIFGDLAHLEILNVIRSYVKTYIDKEVTKEWNELKAWCNIELTKPMTYDIENLKKKEDAIYRERVQKRNELRQTLADAEMEAVKGAPKQKNKKNEACLEPDPYRLELLMSAKAKAYYEIASTRFVDNVCLGIEGRLIPSCTEELVADLKNYLGVEEPSKHPQIIKWMTEDSDRERRRRDLTIEKTRLTEGLTYISNALDPRSTSPTSPAKRLPSASPEVEGEPKTPSKRHKTAHADENNTPTQTKTPGRLAVRVQTMELDD